MEGRGRHRALKIPEGDAGEQVQGRVIRVVVGRMGHEDLGGPELPEDGFQIRQDLLAFERSPGPVGRRVGHSRGPGEAAAARRPASPVIAPEAEGAVIGVAEKREVPSRHPQNRRRRQGLLPAQGSHRQDGLRQDHRALAIGEEGPLVAVAIGEEDDARGQPPAHRLPQHARRSQHLVVRVGSENEDAVALPELKTPQTTAWRPPPAAGSPRTGRPRTGEPRRGS